MGTHFSSDYYLSCKQLRKLDALTQGSLSQGTIKIKN